MFAYCGNNPISRFDESGNWWHIAIGAVVGAAVAFASTVATDYIENGKVDLAAAGISALFGAASGALAATGYGKLVQITGGALLSGAESIVSQAHEKGGIKNVNAGRVLIDMVMGGIGSRGNGTGKANAAFLDSQASRGIKRIKNAFDNGGFRNGCSELLKAGKYYLSQTATIFYKPLINDAANTVANDIRSSVTKATFKLTIVSAS